MRPPRTLDQASRRAMRVGREWSTRRELRATCAMAGPSHQSARFVRRAGRRGLGAGLDARRRSSRHEKAPRDLELRGAVLQADARGGIRTHDLLLRRQALYPAELRTQTRRATRPSRALLLSRISLTLRRGRHKQRRLLPPHDDLPAPLPRPTRAGELPDRLRGDAPGDRDRSAPRPRAIRGSGRVRRRAHRARHGDARPRRLPVRRRGARRASPAPSCSCRPREATRERWRACAGPAREAFGTAIRWRSGACAWMSGTRPDTLPSTSCSSSPTKRRATLAVGIVSGDFLFVGDVGRPDLLERAVGIEGIDAALGGGAVPVAAVAPGPAGVPAGLAGPRRRLGLRQIVGRGSAEHPRLRAPDELGLPDRMTSRSSCARCSQTSRSRRRTSRG